MPGGRPRPLQLLPERGCGGELGFVVGGGGGEVVADLVQDMGGGLGVVGPVGVDAGADVGLGVVDADSDGLGASGVGLPACPVGEDGVGGFGGGQGEPPAPPRSRLPSPR